MSDDGQDKADDTNEHDGKHETPDKTIARDARQDGEKPGTP